MLDLTVLPAMPATADTTDRSYVCTHLEVHFPHLCDHSEGAASQHTLHVNQMSAEVLEDQLSKLYTGICGSD